eukprot:jgi/Botrbrau1/18563/Bobra.0367s0010.1
MANQQNSGANINALAAMLTGNRADGASLPTDAIAQLLAAHAQGADLQNILSAKHNNEVEYLQRAQERPSQGNFLSGYQNAPMNDYVDTSNKQQHISQQHQQQYMAQSNNLQGHAQNAMHLQASQRGDVSQDPKRFEDRAEHMSLPDLFHPGMQNSMQRRAPAEAAMDAMMPRMANGNLKLQDPLRSCFDVAIALFADVTNLVTVVKAHCDSENSLIQDGHMDKYIGDTFAHLQKLCEIVGYNLPLGSVGRPMQYKASPLIPPAGGLLRIPPTGHHFGPAVLPNVLTSPNRPVSAGPMQGPLGAEGQDGANTEGNKRKRFTDEQLAGLQKLAQDNNWSLPSVTKEDRDKFCEKFQITRDRLHNFFNNRKPKEMKKPRTPVNPRPVGATSGEFTDANGNANESQSASDNAS